MDNYYNKLGVFSGSTLKIIACILMAIDHVGLEIFPEYTIFRIIGRVAFPLFAFFIAEGCKYTKNKLKRFLTVFFVGAILFVFYLFYMGEAYGNIFLTFSVSILLIYLLQFVKKQIFECKNILLSALSAMAFIASLVLLYLVFENVHFEYGYVGMLVPVIVSLFDFSKLNVSDRIKRLDTFPITLLLFAISLIPLSIFGRMAEIQFYCLFAIPLVALYNGKPGSRKMKYAFYIFYPAHLVIIEGIVFLIQILNGG